MRLLITGATGFIGSHLVAALCATQPQISVTLLLREAYGLGEPWPLPLRPYRSKLDVVYADLRNYRLTKRALEQADPTMVLHLAAAGATNPFLPINTALRHNLYGSLHLMRACFETRTNTQQLLIARTPGELNHMNVYAASKAAAWQLAQMYARTQGWPISGGMIYQAYGPRQPASTLIPAAIRAALKGEDFPMTSGRQQRDWIYISDVTAALIALLEKPPAPGSTLDIGTGQLTAVKDVVAQIYALVNRGGKPRPGLLPDRDGEVVTQVADVTKMEAVSGWKAAVSLPQGLATLIETTTYQ